MTGTYDSKPWLQYYGDLPPELAVSTDSMLEVFTRSVERAPDAAVIKYFDGVITMAELDRITDAMAVGLREQGFERGDRLAIMLQNTPQWLIGAVGTWKAGGIAVAVNPMNREREVTYILKDSGATAILCLESIWQDVVSKVQAPDLKIALTTSELEYQTRNDERIFKGIERIDCPGTTNLERLIEEHDGAKPEPVEFSGDDIAFLTYTSGTTGEPKGATNTHLNMVHNAMAYRDWIKLGPEDAVYAVAPLFHITGLIGHLALALLVPLPCVLTYRFDPAVTPEAIEEHQCTFTIGSITVFIALMNSPDVKPEQLKSLQKVYSGGAPIPPAVLEAFEKKFGLYIHNAYGLTETTSPTHFGPLGQKAPVDPDSGATSVGVPIFGTVVRILDEDGNEMPAGQVGELQSEGPGVVPAYWNKPEATEKDIPGGRLNTGDVGFMNSDGWFFIVDRKKDMINASGYKVWPREVEDVLYTHPAIREAAVVGIADDYRGETVKAVVSLQAGQQVTPEELTAFCKERMAAYKYPRIIEIIDELPKTVSGKILRRELRH